jgi:RNA polymerase subunit RPABC4/transcription elongation factor Spt4
MKLCFSCGRVTARVPSYCHYCGKTYNVRLCLRGHINLRSANVCSQCGSKELSTPQRKIPFLLKPLIFLLSHLSESFDFLAGRLCRFLCSQAFC